jgi:periplasmic protein CpxP/Spy
MVTHSINQRPMRTLIALGAFALIANLSVSAQETKASTADNVWVALNTEQLNLQLNLNDEQKKKVKEIDQRFVQKHEALEKAEPKLNEKEMSNKTAALMNERDRELKTVLNAEQYAKWEKMRHKGTSDLTEEKKEKMEK